MGGKWVTKRFGECATLVRDTISPAETAGSSYIGLEHIGERTLTLLGVGVAEDVTSAKFRFRRGDILFGKLRPYFRKVVRVPFDGVCSTDIWVVRPNDGIDPGFLFYCMASQDFVDACTRGSEGTKMPRARWEFVSRITQPVPPLPEQRAIAHILGTLDDKIELNGRMNETLEAMARAIFKAWFVDFLPVRAKMEGRQPYGLDATTALSACDAQAGALFPDRFEDSELGEIPAGWKVRDLSQVTAQITKGTTPTQNDISNAPTSDSQITYLRVNAIADDGSILYDKLTKIPETVHKGALKRSILRTNDVVYTIAGTIGRIAVIEDDLLPANTNQAVAIIRPKPGIIPPGFLVLAMREQAFQEELHSNIVHAVQANLSLGMISRAKAVFPPLESLDPIFKPIEDILRKASTNRRESRTLATLRDALLPKLISGEIRVTDAERIVGRAV